MNQAYYVYMLRCADNTIYTGITTDPARRESEHTGGGDTHAAYTRTHRGVGFLCVWQTEGRSRAQKLEWRIKRLSREQKEQLAAFPHLLPDKITDIDATDYRVYRSKEAST